MKKIALIFIVLISFLNIFSCNNFGQSVKMVTHDDTMRVRKKFIEIEEKVLGIIGNSLYKLMTKTGCYRIPFVEGNSLPSRFTACLIERATALKMASIL